MLEKVVTELFSLLDKYVRIVKGRDWHTPPTLEAGKSAKHEVSAANQGGSSKNKNKKKKNADDNNGGVRYPVRNSMHHDAEECREIKKPAEQYRGGQRGRIGVPERQKGHQGRIQPF
jgi:hypothetical protein